MAVAAANGGAWAAEYAALRGSLAPEAAAAARPAEGGPRGGSLLVPAIIVNLTKGIVGAGILCLPFGMYECGLGLGLVSLGLMALLSLAGFLAIGYACHATGSRTFCEAWQRTVGVCPVIVDVMIFLECIITGIGYMVLTLDYASVGLQGLFGFEAGPLLRPKLAAVFTAAVLVPLCLRPNLDALKPTSQLGIFILAHTILFVILNCALSGEVASRDEVAHFLGPHREGVFRSLVVMTSAYIAHYSAPDHMASASTLPTPWSSFCASASVAFAVALVAYCAFAACGFATFGAAVKGNILLNYEGGVNVMIAWLSMAFMLLLTFPLAFKSARDIIAKALNLEPEKEGARPGLGWSLATTASVVVTVVLGVVFQDISKVLAFRGAVLGCPISFAMPGAMLYCCPRGGAPREPAWQKPLGVLLVAFGTFAGLMGLFSTCMAL